MRAVVSAPIAKSILEDYITALNIKKHKKGLEKEYRYFDTKYYTLENVVGLDINEAKELLKNFDVEYSGQGSKVISMSPKQGSRIKVGSVVRLMLGN